MGPGGLGLPPRDVLALMWSQPLAVSLWLGKQIHPAVPYLPPSLSSSRQRDGPEPDVPMDLDQGHMGSNHQLATILTGGPLASHYVSG